MGFANAEPIPTVRAFEPRDKLRDRGGQSEACPPLLPPQQDSTPLAVAGRTARLGSRPAVDEHIRRPTDHNAATSISSACDRSRASIDENVARTFDDRGAVRGA